MLWLLVSRARHRLARGLSSLPDRVPDSRPTYRPQPEDQRRTLRGGFWISLPVVAILGYAVWRDEIRPVQEAPRVMPIDLYTLKEKLMAQHRVSLCEVTPYRVLVWVHPGSSSTEDPISEVPAGVGPQYYVSWEGDVPGFLVLLESMIKDLGLSEYAQQQIRVSERQEDPLGPRNPSYTPPQPITWLVKGSPTGGLPRPQDREI